MKLVSEKAPQDFEWRGVVFRWNWHRMTFAGGIALNSSERTHSLLVRETLPGTWECWVEWYGGYTMSCTMASRELALEGATLELKSFYEKALADLGPFLPGTSA